MKRAVFLAAGGAVLGFVAEILHRRAGVWVLDTGGAMPAWVGLVYFLGLLGAALALRAFERGHPGALPLGPDRLLVEAALLAAAFVAPIALHRHELALLTLTLVYLAVRLGLARAPGDVAVALAVAAADTVVEGGLVSAGLYHYPHASLGPLPLWLPPLWAGLGLGLRRLLAAP
jgi:hypothetical protein